MTYPTEVSDKLIGYGKSFSKHNAVLRFKVMTYKHLTDIMLKTWNGVLLEKVTFAHLLKTFFSLYGNRVFTVMLTRARSWSIPEPNKYKTFLFEIRFNIIIPSTHVSSSGLYSSVFPLKFACLSHLPHACYVPARIMYR
jgi:hypothetical protein